ncbi:MAG: MFS transporter [Saprospiraceae bacterium]
MVKERLFSPYEIFVIAILAILQFTIILDFMVLSPLGAQLLPALKINTTEFGFVVSVYAFSAGASGLLAAGFADRYDRKRLLLFFYAGFIIGTFLCGIAPTYWLLLAARMVTGIFGGVLGSVAFAIVTDLFQVKVRGQVMGYLQMAFAASQVLGLPAGLYASNLWDWHAPFLLIAAFSVPLWLLVYFKMKPVDMHLAHQEGRSALQHLWKTVSKPRYLRGFAATALLATGGFMLMPFGSAFAVNNLGLHLDDLPVIYLVTGLCTLVTGPLLGKLTDRAGAYRVFVWGTVHSIIMVLVYCHLGVTPLWILLILNPVLFAGIMARMVSSSAMLSTVPAMADRGAFMGVNSSLSQISGGFASALAGVIVFQSKTGHIERYPVLGWVVAATMVVSVWLLYYIHRMQKEDA